MGKKKFATYFAGADITRKIMIGLIVVMMATVVVFAIYKAINTPEKMTKDRIGDYVRAYYEDYFYPKTKASTSSDKFEETMRNFAERGLDDGRVSLRQLMLHDGGHFSNELSVIADYCDLDKTFAEIYPTKPYGKTDYRVEYKYSCNF